MTANDWWQAFCKTGRIEDYLRYRGVDIYRSPTASVKKEQSGNGDQNRRSDTEGKQQYR